MIFRKQLNQLMSQCAIARKLTLRASHLLGLIVLIVHPLITSNALSAESQTTYNYPGGIAQIRLNKLSDNLPEVKYGIRDPIIIEHPQYWQILIGIGLDTLPGEYLVYLKRAVEDARSENLTFNVEQRNYPLHANTRQSLKNAHKIHSGLSDIDFNNTQQPNLPLSLPASGQWADEFGYIVINNKNNKAQTQNFVTLTTTELLTVNAPENAIVSKIEADKNGLSTVFLDHGRGLYSVLSGVADLSVEIGNGVVAGAVIGKLPSQKNRDAVKQLTWQCIINGAYVNPLILTKL